MARAPSAVSSAIAHRDDANLIAILFAKQSARAGFNRRIDVHQPCFDRRVLQHDAVGDVFHFGKFFGRDWLWVREIETQTIRRNERTLLRDVIAKNVTQQLMQKMRRRMVGAHRTAAAMIDVKLDRKTDGGVAAFDSSVMDEQIAELFMRVGHAEAEIRRADQPGIADLTAGFAIERRLVEDHLPGFACRQPLDLTAVLEQCDDDTFGTFRFVAEEVGRADALFQRKPDRTPWRLRRSPPGPARVSALLLHRSVETFDIDAKSAPTQGVLRQIEREAIGVVEFESGCAGQHAALR